MTIQIETTWTSEVRNRHVHLRCLTGPAQTLADRSELQQRLDAGEGEAFVGALADAKEQADGVRGRTPWRVVVVEAVGPTGAAFVPVLVVGTNKRARVIHGRASRVREEAVAHAEELAAEVRDGVVDLGGRRQRAKSCTALRALIDATVAAAQDVEAADPGTRVELALPGWHETDLVLAEMLARRVRELLSS